MYQQLPLNRVGQNDERINSNGVYGLSRVADSGLQYDTNNFPVLSSQQTRYSGGINNPYPSGNAPQREDEFHNLNDDDFPALPGSHKSHLRNDISDDFNHSMELHNGAPNRPPNNAMFYPNASSSGNIHPPSPGLYPSSNTTPTITPNRPKPFTLSPKLTASSEGSTPLRPEAKFGLLGLLDVIRLTDRVIFLGNPSY